MKTALTATLALLLLWFLPGQTPGRSMNGFDLTNTLVPFEEIHAGGPPRDGIPAIDRPRFQDAEHAVELEPDDRVLGLVMHGSSRAYPIDILNWHEIVNDRFDQTPVIISYCPLCGTGMAFHARVDDETLSFGVSGLLYNSDLLLYDRETESLWSQIDRRAISGRYQGVRLRLLPMEHTTWEDWRSRHPATQVLTRGTGFARDYERSPYAGYEESNSLYFPVRFLTQGYHPKERVLGVEIDGRFKAYPFSELSKGKGLVLDRFAQRQVRVRFDRQHQSARIEDEAGNPLPAVVAYWFAWYAFHPDTDIYRVKIPESGPPKTGCTSKVPSLLSHSAPSLQREGCGKG